MEKIDYQLTYKRIKRIRMHVDANGQVLVSAPFGVKKTFLDAWVHSKRDWIEKQRHTQRTPLPLPSFEAAYALFSEISDRIFSLFADVLPQKPIIKVKDLKSAWGICHYTKGYITFNRALAAKPREAVEYVVLHEYVHFLEPNHQAGFHQTMARLMPDYSERKRLLKEK